MPLLSLEFNLEALRKLAERGLSKEEALSLFGAAQVVWTANPNPRAEHSRYVIGPTPDGRMITVVVDRDTDDHSRRHVMTAWDAPPGPDRPLPEGPLTRHMEGMAEVHDNAPDAFDDALAEAEVHLTPGNPDIAVTVTVPIDGGNSTA